MSSIGGENYQSVQRLGKRKVKSGLPALFFSALVRFSFAATGLPGLPIPDNPDESLGNALEQMMSTQALIALRKRKASDNS